MENDPPHGEGSEPGDDMWTRLQALEDMATRPAPPPEPVDPATSIQSRIDVGQHRGPEPTPNVPPSQYFVGSPASGPNSAPASDPASALDRQAKTRAAAAKYAAQSAPAQRPPGQQSTGQGGRSQTGRGPNPAPARRSPSRRKKWYRPKLRWFFLYLPLLIMLSILGAGIWAWTTVNGLYRVELGDSLAAAPGDSVNYLIVGSDSRDGIDANTPNVGAIGTNTEVSGRRSDTIIVLKVQDGSATMMSIPRDLWVTNAATGQNGRINGSYAAGPDNLVRTVTANLGIPINRYIEIDFVSFAGMVDAMGGIDIDFAHPVIDPGSGLKIPTAGTHRLDGAMALAYVRSRHYYEEIDGVPVQDPTADLGRQGRQQNFIRTILQSVGDTRNPLTLLKTGAAGTKGVRVDSELGFGDVLSLARSLSGAEMETVVLPTAPANKGGAAVLVLRDAEALPVLQQFGA